MYIYGAHLIKNGAHLLMEKLMAGGWITHLATNGASVIHDWEWAHHGRSTESVRANVAPAPSARGRKPVAACTSPYSPAA
jgi:hypothetical protein